MRRFAPALLFPLLLGTCLSAQEEALPAALPQDGDNSASGIESDNHMALAEALIDFLARTESCLAACTDAASTAAATPTLQQLRQEATALAERQAALPEPTVQDYMAVQSRANDFLQHWQAIRAHLARMEKDGLLTPTIRELLHIAPDQADPKR